MSQQNLSNPLPSNTYQKTEPFLWIHLAALAAVPLTLILCMMGLAVGNPVFPGWLEMLVLGLPPVALSVWLQWQQPLSPFSLWAVAKPERDLSDNQLRVFTVLKRHTNGWHISGWIAAVTGLFAYVVFRQMYLAAPLASGMAPFPDVLRLFGILWAEVFFLVSNLLLQAGISAARVMLVPQAEFDNLPPYAPDKIKSDFTVLGMRSPKLLEFDTEQSNEPFFKGTVPSELQPGATVTTTASPSSQPAPATTSNLLDSLKRSLDSVFGQESPVFALWAKLIALWDSRARTSTALEKQPEPVPQVSAESSAEEDEFWTTADEPTVPELEDEPASNTLKVPKVPEPASIVEAAPATVESEAQLEYPEISSELEVPAQLEVNASEPVAEEALGKELEDLSTPEVTPVEVDSEWEEQVPGQHVATEPEIAADDAIADLVLESSQQLETSVASEAMLEEGSVAELAVGSESTPVATTETADISHEEQPVAVTDESNSSPTTSDRQSADSNDEWA